MVCLVKVALGFAIVLALAIELVFTINAPRCAPGWPAGPISGCGVARSFNGGFQ